MGSKYAVLIAFIVVAAAQLYVPAKMILDREDIIDQGKEYKFLTAPIDPTDPFRGKYIILSFDENTVEVEDSREWMSGDDIFVHLKEDENGFAQVVSVSKVEPVDHQDYVKAKVRFVFEERVNNLEISYPFDRYYMEESKAYDAEIAYRDSQVDTSSVTYALVNIMNGEAVLKDVLIDGIPIKEFVERQREEDSDQQPKIEF